MAEKGKTNVYIDGFNLYYCGVKGTTYKWLDLKKICEFYFPNLTINKIKYFTAIQKSQINDPDKKIRQLAYLRAIKTIGCLDVIKGHFSAHEKWRPLIPRYYKPKYEHRTKVKVSWLKFNFFCLSLILEINFSPLLILEIYFKNVQFLLLARRART